MADIRQIYKTDFDGTAYAKEYLIGDEYEKKWAVEEFYHRVFSQNKVNGKTLIEVGHGPAMRSALSASGKVSEIYLGDLLECNREIVTKWLNKAPDALDYSKMYKYVANLEGKDDIKYLEDRVRKCVKEVISCDILADNPLSPRPMQQFDIVTSSYCFDSFPDYKDYMKAWNNIAALTRPGGYVASVNIIDCSIYKVGDKILPCSNIGETPAKNAICQSGLKILEFEKFMFKTYPVSGSDWKGIYTVLAQKC